MTAGMRAVVVTVCFAMALPILPLFLGWRTVLRSASGTRSRTELFGLSLATLSYSWLLAILAWGRAIAPDYSHLRFTTIYTNIAVALVGMIVGALRGAKARGALVTAFVLLLVLWLYVATVSSVV